MPSYPPLELEPTAARVRDLLAEAAPLLERGDPAWETRYRTALRLVERVADPVSADDARTRVGVFGHHIDRMRGDHAAALGRLADAEAAITRQRARGLDPARLDDHEFGVHLGRAQLLAEMHEFDAAAAEFGAASALAERNADPAGRRRTVLAGLGALELLRSRYPQARTAYETALNELLAELRNPGPDAPDRSEELPILLTGVAQAQTFCGDLDAAERTMRQAEQVAGHVESQAQLLRLRSFLLSARQRPGAEAHRLEEEAQAAAEYAEFVARHERQLASAHRGEAQKQLAHQEHLGENVFLAREQYRAAVDRARAEGDRVGAATATLRLAAATQDCALVSGDAGLHVEAIELAQRAQAEFVALGRTMHAAAADVDAAAFVSQWHPEPDAEGLPRLAAAAAIARVAAVALHERAFDAEQAAWRRRFAEQYVRRGLELAMQLTFLVGDAARVAELIELRAASAQFAAGAGGELAASAPPPLRWSADRLVLADEFAQARQRYGLAPDPRQPAPAW